MVVPRHVLICFIWRKQNKHNFIWSQTFKKLSKVQNYNYWRLLNCMKYFLLFLIFVLFELRLLIWVVWKLINRLCGIRCIKFLISILVFNLVFNISIKYVFVFVDSLYLFDFVFLFKQFDWINIDSFKSFIINLIFNRLKIFLNNVLYYYK